MDVVASPQLDDGFTRIANELLEALIAVGLTSRQWAVVMAIIRKTYGFNKKADDIGLSQIVALTGIAKPHVSVAIRELEARAVITRSQGKFGHVLGVNKNHQAWLGVTKSVTPKSSTSEVGVTESVTPQETQPVMTGVTESVTVTELVTVTESVTGGYQISNTGVTESVTTKDKPTKDNQQKTKGKGFAPPDWLPADAWDGYLEMRKRIKKPMTDYAMKLAVGELGKLRDAGQDPEAVLNQSTMKSWQGLFEVKANNGKPATGNRHGGFGQQNYHDGIAPDGSF